MASNTDPITPGFFNTPEGIQSAIGLNIFLFGFMVAGIIGKVSVLVLVPIVNSIAVCVVNGLVYYDSHTKDAPLNRAVDAAFGSLAFLVQEASLPFYNYVILKSMLRGRELKLFRVLFWVLMLVILVLQVAIAVFGVGYHLGSPAYSADAQKRVLLGYYLSIAIIECISAFFLLKNFRALLRSIMSSPLRGRGGRLYRYMMCSTEIRLATMAFIGIGRTIVASLKTTVYVQGVVGQIDQFIYTVECLFPIVMYIDILSSRLIFADESSKRGNNILDIQGEGGSGQPLREPSAIINHCDRVNEMK